jgi:hypothetical protein
MAKTVTAADQVDPNQAAAPADQGAAQQNGGTAVLNDPTKMTPEAKALEASALADAQRQSREMAERFGPGHSPPGELRPHQIIKPGDPTVLCNFPKRVPLRVNNHSVIDCPAGTYQMPSALVTEWVAKTPDGKSVTGMHPYLVAHGVKVVDQPKAPA